MSQESQRQGKKFAADFERIDEVKGNDKILIFDSKTGVVMYATPSQINAKFDQLVADIAAAIAAKQAAEAAQGAAESAATGAMGYAGAASDSADEAEGFKEAAGGIYSDTVDVKNDTQNIYNNTAALLSTVNNLLDRFKRDFGYCATATTKTLTQGVAGKYVKCSTRAAVSNASFDISAPISIDACSKILIKTGFNPSDGSHASLDISVISIYEEIERQRQVQKKNASNQPLYYEVDVDGNPTEVETITVTPFPVYITEEYTETRYLPNNEDRFVAIPDSGYYVANIPQSCKIVVSYKPGVTDTSIIVVKHGDAANLTSQLLGIYEKQTLVEALTKLAAILEAEEARGGKAGHVQAATVDAQEFLVNKYPDTLLGHGAPSASTRPDNLPADLPWDGVPSHKGQKYIDQDAASSGFYYAIGFSSVGDWKH